MARMRMAGVVPTPLSGACISWDLLVNYYGMSEPKTWERLLHPFLATTEILLLVPHFWLLVGRGRAVVDSVAATDATRSSAAMDTILLLRAVGMLPR